MNKTHPLSHRDIWFLAVTVIICLSVGYAGAIFLSGNALGKAPLQCPANCTGEDCPMHQNFIEQ
ncbi:MAG TPA: hypothetical protein VJB60_03320 [Candidatus Peribacterales bacterium]|nr:hypothetical protein [Candidatus Peribacterales bacterium]